MKSKILIIIGAIMLIIAGGITGYNIYSDLYSKSVCNEIKAQIDIHLEKEQVWEEKYKENQITEMPTINIKGKDYIGILEIDRVDLSVPIISELTMSNLYTSPCRYTGSVYSNDLVLGGHSYVSTFGKLHKVIQGDEVLLTDIDGNKFIYEVKDVEIIQPTEVEYLTESDWDLSLFTCTYSGQTRLVVRCLEKE